MEKEISLPSFELLYLNPSVAKEDYTALKNAAAHIRAITRDLRPDDKQKIKELEECFGFPLPTDLKNMLSEFIEQYYEGKIRKSRHNRPSGRSVILNKRIRRENE